MKLYKEAYEQLISEDIKALNDQMVHCPESSHIENVLKDSVRFYYPEHISTVQDCELAVFETKKKAIKAACNHCIQSGSGCGHIDREDDAMLYCQELEDFIKELNV